MTTIGNYELVDILGRGSSGVVWRARAMDGGPDVALKVLFDNVAHDEQTVRRFIASARLLLDAPIEGAVRVLDVVHADGHVAMAMELIEAPSLRELLERGPLSPVEVAEIGAEVAATLARAHAAGIVHRDVKPENILVRRDGVTGELTALLSDFGIASSMDARSTLTTTQPGTSAYTSPETFEDSAPAPARDVYALGIVMYEMGTGARPFRAAHPAALMREHLQAEPPAPVGMPPGLWALVASCLAKDPSRRPTASAVGDGLRAVAVTKRPWVAPHSDDAPTVTRLPRLSTDGAGPGRTHRPRGRYLGVAIGVAIALIASLGVAYVALQRSGDGGVVAVAGSTRTADSTHSPTGTTTKSATPTSSPPTSSTGSPTRTRTTIPAPPPSPGRGQGSQRTDRPAPPEPTPVIVDPRPPASTPEVTPAGPKCPGADCNGARPSAFGGVCRRDAAVVDSSSGMGSADSNLPQRLDLVYSSDCQTAWAVATVTADPGSLGYFVYVETTGGRKTSTPVSSAPSAMSVMVDLSRGDCVEASLFYKYKSRGRDPVELSNRWCAAR